MHARFVPVMCTSDQQGLDDRRCRIEPHHRSAARGSRLPMQPRPQYDAQLPMPHAKLRVACCPSPASHLARRNPRLSLYSEMRIYLTCIPLRSSRKSPCPSIRSPPSPSRAPRVTRVSHAPGLFYNLPSFFIARGCISSQGCNVYIVARIDTCACLSQRKLELISESFHGCEAVSTYTATTMSMT
jgi:hypothetical protein